MESKPEETEYQQVGHQQSSEQALSYADHQPSIGDIIISDLNPKLRSLSLSVVTRIPISMDALRLFASLRVVQDNTTALRSLSLWVVTRIAISTDGLRLFASLWVVLDSTTALRLLSLWVVTRIPISTDGLRLFASLWVVTLWLDSMTALRLLSLSLGGHSDPGQHGSSEAVCFSLGGYSVAGQHDCSEIALSLWVVTLLLVSTAVLRLFTSLWLLFTVVLGRRPKI